MSKDKTHTHTGTCQACGAQQAMIIFGAYSDRLAYHGYKVAGFGYFAGVCSGSHLVPAEHGVEHTHKTITALVGYAARHSARAQALTDGADKITNYETSEWCRKTHKYLITVHAVTPETPPDVVAKYTKLAITEHESCARHARSHIAFLQEHVLPRLGRPLTPVDTAPRPKPVDGMVNVKAGTIEGAFHTKAAQKAALDKISREYDRVRSTVTGAVLAIDYDARTKEQLHLYHELPYDLHNYRARHGVLILSMFPEMTFQVAEMARLQALRNEVKAQPVVKGGAK